MINSASWKTDGTFFFYQGDSCVKDCVYLKQSLSTLQSPRSPIETVSLVLEMFSALLWKMISVCGGYCEFPSVLFVVCGLSYSICVYNQTRNVHLLALDSLCDLLPGELCAHICVPIPGSYYCLCREGFTLMADGKSCQHDDLPNRYSSNLLFLH